MTSRRDILTRVFNGHPTIIDTSWGKAEKWVIQPGLCVVNWEHNEDTALVFIPHASQDSRLIEWKASQQPAWFRQNYPEFADVHLGHSPDMELVQTFDQWANSVNVGAVRIIAKQMGAEMEMREVIKVGTTNTKPEQGPVSSWNATVEKMKKHGWKEKTVGERHTLVHEGLNFQAESWVEAVGMMIEMADNYMDTRPDK